MIYTLGRTTNYNKYLRENPEAEKLGRTDDYPGGSVWRTQEEAQTYVDGLPNAPCPEWSAADFSVYGVEADWEVDTYQEDPAKPWRALKRNALLVLLS